MGRKLSKRLSACLDALSSLSRIADIGTDHAYLPCYGVAHGTLDSAIAIDIIDGPLAQAKRTVADYGLADKVELRKGSGLEPLDVGEVEGVNIAGMGGKLISQLLKDSLPVAKSMEILVFQPQGGEPILRQTLSESDFTIIDELLLEEDGIVYSVITAKPKRSDAQCNCLDWQFGPVLRQHVEDELFIKKWTAEMVSIEGALSRIPEGHPNRIKFETKQQLIKDVLAGAIR